MPVKNGATIAKKWVGSMQSAGTTAAAGAQSVTENPMEKAAAAQDRYAAGAARAAAENRYADGCRTVSLQAWQQAFIKKGAPRMAEGASQAQAAVAAFHDWHQPICDQSRAECAAGRADGTMDGRARMLKNYENLKGKRYPKSRR
jgi:hypothetical protein